MKDIISKISKLNIRKILKLYMKKIPKLNIKTLVEDTYNKIFARRRKKRTDMSQRPEFILHQKPKSPVTEAYRMLRTNIQYSSPDRKLRCILVTSSGPREGKTTTVINLGCAFAQANKKTLIVDSDLRNTSFHRLFNLNNDFGFTSIILGQKRIDEVIYKDVLIPNLNILTSGPGVTNPAEMIGSRSVANFMDTIKTIYDIIIFDSPPTLAVTDAKLLSFNVDGVILVVQSGKMAREVAKRAKESLTEINANIIGALLNDLNTSKEGYCYYYKYYYSYYKEKKDAKEKLFVEEKIEQKPGIEQKPEIVKKKDLFIPAFSDRDINNKLPSPKLDSIVTMLSEEEKKEAKVDKSIDKSSVLGRKTVFFKETDRSIKEKKPDRQHKDKSSLGKKDIFKDI